MNNPSPPTRTASTAPGTAAKAGASADTGQQQDIASLLDAPGQRRWYRRPLLWAIALAVALLLAGLWYWQRQKAARAEPLYTTQVASIGNLTQSVTANGSLQPTRSIHIGSELSGTVREVYVDVNDRVKKGQVLLELDSSKLQNQIARSQASIAAALGKQAQSRANVADAKARLARLEELARISAGKVPAQTELDSARAALERAMADAASAQASVQDARAALATDQINLGKAFIRAPSDGIVLTRAVDAGNAVAASLQAVTLFTLAESLNRLRLWVYVDEADVGTVQVGQPATFTVSAFLARQFPATITRVGFGSTITDNVVTYLTWLDVDNRELLLRPGMSATASITVAQRQQVLLVPNSALRFMPNNTSPATGKPALSLLPRMPGSNARRSAADRASTATARQVWVLPQDGKGSGKGSGKGIGMGDSKGEGKGEPQAVAVTPGISDGHMTEIIGGDLKPGMWVVTGQKVRAAP